MSLEWMPQIDRRKCQGCGDCISACPTGALGWRDGQSSLLYPEKCTYCADCETICPLGAIELPYLILKSENLEEAEDE